MASAYIHVNADVVRSVRVVATGARLHLLSMHSNNAKHPGVRWVLKVVLPDGHTTQMATSVKAKANEMLTDIDEALANGSAVSIA